LSLPPGTRLGVYEITAHIGQGGMGEVYRATDTKLKRQVAIKILPSPVAADTDRLARFQREAEVLASLNHPHIAGIYGLEESAGITALVMELVEGQDLSQRLARGAIPMDEALPIARQIAEALEAAHEQGIIHRDLKPANIKIRADGAVKVLDFGLAKALDPASSSSADVANSPTLSVHATMQGVILGTAAYMSPEQAKGRAVDKRADIWAFGVVLYEMLLGERAFKGDGMSEILASVLKDTPSFDALPPGTPPRLKRLLERCLDRDVDMRLRDIGEARIILTRPEVALPARAPGAWRGTPMAAAGAFVLAGLMGAVAWYLKPMAVVPVRRFELPAAIEGGSEPALSPDGTRIAYVSGGHLYVRALDALDSQDLGLAPAAEVALFWSPDSSTIGFTAEGQIRSIPAAGGPPFVICKVPSTARVMGITWLVNGTIVFSVWRDSLYSVPASGGHPSVLLPVDMAREVDFHSVSALPDARVIVNTHPRKEGYAEIVELLGNGKRVSLIVDPDVFDTEYAPPDMLLFIRRRVNTGLWAVPFNGAPPDLSKATLLQAGATSFSAAGDGTLVVGIPTPPMSALVWIDRAGKQAPVPGTLIALALSAAISPDGRRAAFFAGPAEKRQLFARDLESGTDTLLTLSPLDLTGQIAQVDVSPQWIPPGDRIVYQRGSIETTNLVAQRSDAAGAARTMIAADSGKVSRDGRNLVFALDERGSRHLRWAPLSADGTAGSAKRIFQDEPEPAIPLYQEYDLSPDGRLLAYSALQPDQSWKLFLTEFPNSATVVLVADGGGQPRFSTDGAELFYLADSGGAGTAQKVRLMAARVALAPDVKIGPRTPLFDESGGVSLSGYDVAQNGQRFLVRKAVASGPNPGMKHVLVQNWLAARQGAKSGTSR
jgi:hypothetical protein